jgi:hypothetical protein
VELFISDKCMGLLESLVEYHPEAQFQRCTVHFCRNVFTDVSTTKVKEVAAMLKAIHAQADLQAVVDKEALVVGKLKAMGVAIAVRTVGEHHGGADLRRLSSRAVEEASDQQPDGAGHAGDRPPHSGCG